MKFKTTIVLCCLSTLLVLAMGHQSPAQQNSVAPWNQIGVVSVMKVLRLSQKNTEHFKKVQAEQNGWRAELQKEAQELQADEASLKTMRPGSEDHFAHFRGMLMKQAKLEATEKFYNQMASAKGREWTEKMYQEVLAAVSEVAREMGLKMVFERTEPEFPLPNEQALASAMNTHKLLFDDGLVDISDQVIDKIDAKIDAPQN
ncbi:MAG: OmpH family outer membrane protein [Planctomycetes bacterium]|nr:OmpH family outer membrane protein [Planctomycetota bacterium]